MTPTLSGKVVVITGSSRGFGRAIADACLDAGANVVITSRSESKAKQTALELHDDPKRIVGTGCDVGDLAQVKALLDFTLETFGKVDVWVNNAGIAGSYGPVHEVHPDDFSAVLQTNIRGTYYGSWVAINTFRAQGYGTLINILGRGDTQPTPFQAAYATSKAWVRQFTITLAKENADSSIGIYSYNPGLMTTDFLGHVDVVAGHESRLAPFKTITRMWGQMPDIPAQKIVQIASQISPNKSGKSFKATSFGFIFAGALREGWRQLILGNKPEQTAEYTFVPPAKLEDL